MNEESLNAGDLRELITSFVKHKSKMIEHLGYSTHRMGQLRAIATIKARLAHVPLHDTQRMINAYHMLRHEISQLLPGTHSRFSHQRERIEQVLAYAREHHTIRDYAYVYRW